VKLKLIHKHILKELLPIFLLGNIFFVLLLLLDKLVDLSDLFFTKSVPAWLIIQTVISYLPSFFVITIPTSAMLAVIFVFGRMSSESEIIAMRSFGAGRRFFLLPTMIFAIGVFLMGIAMSAYFMPKGSFMAAENVLRMAKLVSIKDIKEKELYEELKGYVFYAEKKKSDTEYERLMIIDKNKNSVITAQSAQIIPTGDAGLLLELSNGRIATIREDNMHSTINFEKFSINAPLSDASRVTIKTERLMPMSELMSNFKEDPIYKFEYSKRFSMPFAAIIMCVFGMSIGMFFHRSGKTLAIPSTVFIVVIYNMMFLVAQNIATEGSIDPFFAAWVPNIFFGILSIFAYERVL
jgi:lipopolysaccharide export system permease protein